jgi:hypothetical protein
MYQELISLVDERKKIEEKITIKKAEMEKAIEIDVAILDDLKAKEKKLREEVYQEIEKSGEEKIEVGDKIIIPQMRKIKQYINVDAIMRSICNNAEKIAEIGYNATVVAKDCFRMERVFTDKKTIIDIVEKFEKVEGKLLDGVEEKKTEYVLIKDKATNDKLEHFKKITK